MRLIFLVALALATPRAVLAASTAVDVSGGFRIEGVGLRDRDASGLCRKNAAGNCDKQKRCAQAIYNACGVAIGRYPEDPLWPNVPDGGAMFQDGGFTVQLSSPAVTARTVAQASAARTTVAAAAAKRQCVKDAALLCQ